MADNKDIEKSLGTVERLISIFKAASSFDPVAGAIVSLIADYIPNQRQVRLEKFAKEVAENFNKFKDEVNDDFIKTNEFAFIFERCFKGVVENYQTEKIQAFKAVLINTLRDNKLPQDQKELFLSLVDRLTILHIKLLAFLTDPYDYVDSRSIPRHHVQGSFKEFLPRVFPGTTVDHLRVIIHDLFGYGFTRDDQGIIDLMTMSRGFELISGRVTPSGREFLGFISLH
jgi:hypothetical protein